MHLWQVFCKCAKRRGKNKENEQIWRLISQEWLVRFTSNLVHSLLSTSTANLILSGQDITYHRATKNRPVQFISGAQLLLFSFTINKLYSHFHCRCGQLPLYYLYLIVKSLVFPFTYLYNCINIKYSNILCQIIVDNFSLKY